MHQKQKGVALGGGTGVLISIITLAIASQVSHLSPFEVEAFPSSLTLIAKCCVIPAGCILYCILRVALFRTESAVDIDGSGLTQPSPEIRILSSLLQNTFEQGTLACILYLVWGILMPPRYQLLVPTACVLFLLGRISFYRGYRFGAPSRALGFALTFIPTIILFVVLVISILFF